MYDALSTCECPCPGCASTRATLPAQKTASVASRLRGSCTRSSLHVSMLVSSLVSRAPPNPLSAVNVFRSTLYMSTFSKVLLIVIFRTHWVLIQVKCLFIYKRDLLWEEKEKRPAIQKRPIIYPRREHPLECAR